ncbi:MAG: urease accessory protein [Candidatus Tokpelaia sp. JSC085]|nr:MAG: urease accessory protein [Candidatus Tokpelaia sp. JSC085]
MKEKEANTSQLLQLMTLLSPFFPVGSFAYSHGIEQSVHDGLITCCADMEIWLRGLLQKGTGWNDTVFLIQAWRNVKTGTDITELGQLACAMSGSSEREMETCMQGWAFLKAAADYGAECPIHSEKLAYPIAVGIIGAEMDIELEALVAAYLHSFISNLVQAGIRLVPLGQKDGVKIMHALENDIRRLSQQARHLTLTDLGSAAIMSDICAMRHETLYTRIFRS